MWLAIRLGTADEGSLALTANSTSPPDCIATKLADDLIGDGIEPFLMLLLGLAEKLPLRDAAGIDPRNAES